MMEVDLAFLRAANRLVAHHGYQERMILLPWVRVWRCKHCRDRWPCTRWREAQREWLEFAKDVVEEARKFYSTATLQ